MMMMMMMMKKKKNKRRGRGGGGARPAAVACGSLQEGGLDLWLWLVVHSKDIPLCKSNRTRVSQSQNYGQKPPYAVAEDSHIQRI